MMEILNGILLGLSITAPVGPTNVEVIRRGLKEGWKSSAMFCLGVVVALVIYLLLVLFGLSVLTKSKTFNLFLLFFGVLVLFYLAYNAFRDFFKNKELDLSGKSDVKKNFVQGIVLTLSNPAVLLLWTGIMGADLASRSASLESGLSLGAGILIGVIFFFTFLIALIHNGRKYINHKNFRYVSLGAGLVLLYFALKFGYEFVMLI